MKNIWKWVLGGVVVTIIVVAAVMANPQFQKGFFQKIPLNVSKISKIDISPKPETACDQSIFFTKYISVSGNNSNDGSKGSPWRDIQYAIDHIPDRGMLVLGEGRFDGSLIISRKNMIIRGAGKRRTFITTNIASGQAAMNIVESPQICIRDLSISGTWVGGDGGYPQELREGIYAESSSVQIYNTSLFNIINAYIIFYKANFLVKKIELSGNELGNSGISDLGISISDSQGTIDHLITNELSGIDHIVDHSNTLGRFTNDGPVYIPITNDSKPLTVKNSTFVASDRNWGDGIRYHGNGKNKVHIINNIFQGRSEVEPRHWRGLVPIGPNGINIYGGHFIISNNIIRDYSTGMWISATNAFYRDTPHITAILQKNSFENNIIAVLNGSGIDSGVNIYDEDGKPHLHYDFGGGEFHSYGRNMFLNNNFNIFQGNNAPIPAFNNIWNARSIEEIEEKIHDQLDDPTLGRVFH